MSFLKKIGIEPFIVFLGLAIFFAWAYPKIGIQSFGSVTLGDVATWGVGLIFFFYGLRLDGKKLKEGLVNIKLHLLVHLSTFMFFPLLILALINALNIDMNAQNEVYYLWIGVFFLATLPSTVSSSVVMVSIAGGNLPAAIFNASVSSLLGVFVTPIWMSIYLDGIEGSRDLNDVILKLVIQVIMPIVAGLLLNKKLGWFAAKYKKQLRIMDQSVILLIIYTSFCDSFFRKMFSGVPISHILILSAGMMALFIAMFAITWRIGVLLGFSREDKIAATFCGSKKSLVHGSVMSKVLFHNTAVIGVILLPTMIYHAFQLITISIIAGKMRDEKVAEKPLKNS